MTHWYNPVGELMPLRHFKSREYLPARKAAESLGRGVMERAIDRALWTLLDTTSAAS